MRKMYLFKTFLLLCALIVGAGSSWADDYVKVTSSSDLVDGGTYIIANSDGIATSYASKLPTTKDGYTESEGTISTSTASPLEITLGVTSEGKYTLLMSDGKYIGYKGSQTDLRNTQTVSTNTLEQWDIAYNETYSIFTIVNVSNIGRHIGSSGSSTFGAYANMSNNAPATLYKKVMETGEATTVSIATTELTNTDIASGTTAGVLTATVKDSSNNPIVGATLTWTSSNTNVATINESTGEVTLVKKGTTIITATYAGEKGVYKSSSNTYILNVVNSNANDGSSEKPFTPSEAIDALTNDDIDAETDYYVVGFISYIGAYSNGALTYWISDDGTQTNEIQCYKGKGINGVDFSSKDDLELGDRVLVKGKLIIYGSNTYEFSAGSEIVSLTQRTMVNIASFKANETSLLRGNTTITTVSNDTPEWKTVSYTYSSDDESIATVDAAGVITAVSKGTTNINVIPNISADDANYKPGSSMSVEITVYNPSHTAQFSVNGTIDEADNVEIEEGEAITFPTTPAGRGGKTFVGWLTTTIDGVTTEKPATVTSSTMGETDIVFYAVFGDGNSSTGWQKISSSEISEAGTYALLTPDGYAFNGTITSGHGQVTSTAFEFTDGIATAAPEGTCEITFEFVEGGFKFYNTDNKYLYAEKAKSGNLAWQNSESSYWKKTADGNWVYNSNSAYLRSYNNASFRSYAGASSGEDLVFARKTTIYSFKDYCTTVTVSKEVTSNGYASYVTPDNVEFPAGRAFVVTDATNNVKLSEVTSVPAGTPVILKTQGTVIANVLNVTPDAPATNLLTIGNETIPTNKDAYVLAKDGDSAGFKLWTGDESVLEGRVVLLLDKVVGARDFISFDEGETTGLKAIDNGQMTIDNIYDLSGRKIANGKFQKGLYIVNGRKVVIK